MSNKVPKPQKGSNNLFQMSWKLQWLKVFVFHLDPYVGNEDLQLFKPPCLLCSPLIKRNRVDLDIVVVNNHIFPFFRSDCVIDLCHGLNFAGAKPPLSKLPSVGAAQPDCKRLPYS